MSSTISQVFARCREEKRAAFIPFITAGDPNLETTEELLFALARGGADIIELGVPFSDPLADGPVIQRASARGLASGTNMSKVLDLVARTRDDLDVPILLFTYFNLIHARGLETFAEQAATSGVDGVLCVDLPPEEGMNGLVPILAKHGLDTVFLLAPTSPPARIKQADQASSGFVYYVSRTGVTGTRQDLPKELVRDMKKLRKRLTLPVAVGFGISSPQQVKSLAKVADGIVVGSALVRLIEEKSGDADLIEAVEQRVRELTAPLRK